MTRSRSIFLAFVCLAASCAHAPQREQIVRGRVVDDETGAPVADARVYLGSREMALDGDGGFRLCGVVPGRTTARVVASGYHADPMVVNVAGRDSTTLLVRLRRAAPIGRLHFTPSGFRPAKPYSTVIVLDGERVLIDPSRCMAPRTGERRIDALAAQDIASMHVMKGPEAVARFGHDARSGALLITSKAAAARARPE